MSQDDSSIDSDSSLPDVSHLFDKSESNDPISTGDIVFAKYRKLYWPALVRRVDLKKKKICVWFCDQPGKTFKLPLKSICRFSDKEKRMKIAKDISEAGCTSVHEDLTTHAKRYLRRRLEGYEDDPMKFFDQTYPYFLIEKLLKNNPNADVSSLRIPPIYTSLEYNKTSVRDSVLKDESDDSEVVSTDDEKISVDDDEKISIDDEDKISDDDEEKISVGDKEKISDTKLTDCRKNAVGHLQKNSFDLKSSKLENKIVKFITSGKADKRLQAILLKTIKSEFHNTFENTKCGGKIDFTSVNYAGPINNKINELTVYLSSLLEKLTAVHNPYKLHTNIGQNRFFNNIPEAGRYVASVWLPESIIYAISRIQHISICKAKQLFKDPPKVKGIKNVNTAQATFDQDPEIDISEKNCEANKNNSQQIKKDNTKYCSKTASHSCKTLSIRLHKCDKKKGIEKKLEK